MSIYEETNISGIINASWSSVPSRRMSEEFFTKAWSKWLFQLLVALIGTTGNTVIICAFCKKLKTNIANYYTVCLALVDLVSCSIALPLHVAHTAFYFTFRDTMSCKLIQWLRTGLWASSAIILQAIAVDRYRAVCKPFSWRKYKNTKTVVILSICVCMGFVFASPFLFISGAQHYVVTQTAAENYGFTYAFDGFERTLSEFYTCETLNIYDSSWENRVTSLVGLLTFLFLITVTLTCYSTVYATMRKHMKARQTKNKIAPVNLNLSATRSSLNLNYNDNTSAALSPGIKLDGDSRDYNVSVAPKTENCVHSNAGLESTQSALRVGQRLKASSSRQNQYRAAKTFMIVTVAFLATWIPFWVQAVLALIDSNFNLYPNLTYHIGVDFGRELYFVNSASNAFVYYFFNATFRQYCQELFYKIKNCRSK